MYAATAAFHGAATRGDVAAMAREVGRGVPVDKPHRRGRTALHCAAEAGRTAAVVWLLGKGADHRAACGDVQGTPLHHAARMGRLGAAAALIDHGADVDAVCVRGCTPLHYAVWQNRAGVAALLIARGADPDLGLGQTPLQGAVEVRNREVMAVLVDGGANPDVSGRARSPTPRQLADRTGGFDAMVAQGRALRRPWSLRRHRDTAAALPAAQSFVVTVLLCARRIDADASGAADAAVEAISLIPRLPSEMWFAILSMLRGRDMLRA